MNFKIVADSSADALNLQQVAWQTAPLRILTEAKEFTDTPELDVKEMADFLKTYSGKSSTSCPAVSDWLEAFGDGENILCFTITHNLSGSYNSAIIAKEEYESEHQGRKVYVIDSLSTGPEIKLLAEKAEELFLGGMAFEEVCKNIEEYSKTTRLLFVLESLINLANNGRVSSAVAKIAGILGIRVVGRASDEGELQLLDKNRGEKKTLHSILHNMKELGYNGGKVRISNCFNPQFAQTLADILKNEFGTQDIEIYQAGGLCSFYAEKGGLIIGFEK